MASLTAYHRALDYTYAPGLFPTMEALKRRPDLVRRVLLHSKLSASPAQQELLSLCQAHSIRTEQADRALSRISGKENVFAAAVVAKETPALQSGRNHVVLHHISDRGNLGTVLRSALGFGFSDVAVIRPAADHFDPQVIRASMGAMFSLRVAEFDSFEAYRGAFAAHALYPLMLKAAVPLETAASQAQPPYSLILGNEGSGLPLTFAELGSAVRIPHADAIDSLNLAVAASIAMYAFARRD